VPLIAGDVSEPTHIFQFYASSPYPESRCSKVVAVATKMIGLIEISDTISASNYVIVIV